jgi:hypothetical protein
MRLAIGVVLAAIVLQAAADTAVILNSGSTNRAGFRIEVERSGQAEFTSTPRRGQAAEQVRRKVPDALIQRFYADLEAAQPLSALSAEHCAKSVSFGTTTTVEVGSERTPDISCPNARDPNTKALMRDVDEIVQLFRSG